MKEIQVEKDVPLPAHRGRRQAHPWGTMEVGYSFFRAVPPATIGAGAYRYGKIHGIRFTVRAWAQCQSCGKGFPQAQVLKDGLCPYCNSGPVCVGARAWRTA